MNVIRIGTFGWRMTVDPAARLATLDKVRAWAAGEEQAARADLERKQRGEASEAETFWSHIPGAGGRR